jgi:pimeloyl-ACP methyl ester carboxylesterase
MLRRDILKSAATMVAVTGLNETGGLAAAGASSTSHRSAQYVEARDGTELFVRDWGSGPAIVFASAWALNSQGWQYQMVRLVDAGYRCIAFDRRGHGRSGDCGGGYDMETLSDDLARVIEDRGVSQITLIGHSLGAAECVRYLTRHGQSHVRKLVLVAPVTPCMRKSADNPDGIDGNIAEGARALFRADFPGIVAANIRPFVVPQTSQAMIDWIQTMMSQASLQALVECNRAFGEADFRGELPKIAVPTLIIQGDADASCPLPLTGKRTAALIPESRLIVYEGAPHGLIYTHMDRLNGDLQEFLRA